MCGGKGCHRRSRGRAARCPCPPLRPCRAALSPRGRAAPSPPPASFPCPTRVRPPPANQPASYFVRRVPAEEVGLPRAGGRQAVATSGRPAEPPARPFARLLSLILFPPPPLPGVQVSPAAAGAFPGGGTPEENPCAPSPIASHGAGGRGWWKNFPLS